MTENEIKKDLWEMIKANIPIPVILLVVMYIGTIFGGIKIYNVLVVNEKLSKEYIQSVTNRFVWGFLIVTIIVFVVCSVLFMLKKVKRKELLQGNIEAFVVEQDEPSRDRKFSDINQNIKKTYWVLGIGLTSIVDREKMLEKMATDKIAIKLCMMNPDIAVDNLCLNSIECNACILKNLIEEIKEGTVNIENIQERVKCLDNYDDLLEVYHVLINVIYFNEYFNTVTDYRGRIKNSYDSLKRISQSIAEKCGQGFFNLKMADSFIPMSLTIADAYEEIGRMVVEFHLPFTKYKVLFEIVKSDNKELFEVFVNFYNIVWERAHLIGKAERVEKSA